MEKQDKRFTKKEHGKKIALIWRFLKGSKLLFFFAILFTCITALADMIIPQIVRCTVDNVLGGQPAEYPPFVMDLIQHVGGFSFLKTHIWIMALAVLAVAFVKVVSQYAFRICNTKATETLSKTTRDSLFSHIARLPYSWYKTNKTGDIIQRCTSDISTMNEFVSEELTSLFRIIVLLILSILFMLNMHVPLTLIALSIFPVIMLNSVLFDRKIEKNFTEYYEHEGKISVVVQENLTGARVVRAFGQENAEKEKFQKQNAFYTVLGENAGKTLSLFRVISDTLSGLQVMLVIVFGALFCMKGSMTAGEYIAFVSYNTLLSWPLTELGRMITEMSKTSVSIDRIRYIMESEEEKDKENTIKPDLSGDIVFDHVSFGYENCPPVLKDICFRMKAGSTLGILGGTGSGKSTLIMLLDKLYPLAEDGGKITIGGVDITDIDTPYLRKNIGIVLQDPYLFSRTIAENIGIADDAIPFAKIQQATKAACLDETIASFTKGYDTSVGERGVTLSGGQKQRVAIARILTQNTPIMIFDDSLSAVDTETDAKIRASLEAKFGSASIILISHRIATLSKADKILVLDNGKITEQGTHNELIQHNGIYRKIYDIQTGGKEDIL